MFKLVDESGHLTPPLIESVIDSVIVKYAKDCPDLGYGHLSHTISPISKLFNFLLVNAEDDQGKKIFHELFYGFYLNEYTPEDLLKFFEVRGLELNNENIELFISLSRKDENLEYKKYCVYSAIYPYIFDSLVGALNDFVNGNGPPESLQKNIEIIPENGIKKFSLDDLKVSAKLNPLDISQKDAFRNFRIAVDRYLELQSTFKNTATLPNNTNTFIKELHDEIFNVEPANSKYFLPNHYFLNDNVHSSLFYNMASGIELDRQKKEKDWNHELGLILRSDKLAPNITDINKEVDKLLEIIVHEIDLHNAVIWEHFNVVADQIYQIESKLRSIQIPPNIFTSWSPGFANVITGIKHVAVELFTAEKYIDTERQSTFNQVGYNYGVDFLLSYDDPDVTTDNYDDEKVYDKYFLDTYKHEKNIYLINFNKQSTGIGLSDKYVNGIQLKKITGPDPLSFGNTFLDQKFEKGYDTNVGECSTIWIRKKLVRDEYFKNGDHNDDFETTTDSNNANTPYPKIYKNSLTKDLIGDIIFKKTPYDWLCGDDFTLEKDDDRFEANIYINKEVFGSNTVVTPNQFWSIGAPEFMSVYEEKFFAYNFSYSFVETGTDKTKTIPILATDDFGSGSLRALYNLLDTVSYDQEYSTVDLNVQNYYGTTFIEKASTYIVQGVGEVGQGFHIVGDAFQNFFANAKSWITRAWDDVVNFVDFIPNRIRSAIQTQVMLERLISRLTEGLNKYRKKQIIYSDLLLIRANQMSEDDIKNNPIFSTEYPEVYHKVIRDPLIKKVSELLEASFDNLKPSEIISKYIGLIFEKFLTIPTENIFDVYRWHPDNSKIIKDTDLSGENDKYQNFKKNFLVKFRDHLLTDKRFYKKEDDVWRFI